MLKRKTHIDYAKFIGIYLMILCHAGFQNQLTVWIYAFHMPLFFILSGYVIDNYQKTIQITIENI